MRKTKKAVACLVAMLMVLSTLPLAFTASAAQSGVCGDDLTWTLENGVFTVSGYGEMYDNGFPSLDSLMDSVPTTIVIEPGVTHIGAGAFRGWPVTEVSIPQTVTSIGSEAFAYSGLTSVTVPGSVQSWPQAFGYCQQLRTVRIEHGVTKIDDRSFWWCTNLETVDVFPSTLTSIGSGAFIGCSSLTSFGNDGHLEPQCSAIPGWVTEIGNLAFAETGLTDLTIAWSVTRIGDNAFANSALTRVLYFGWNDGYEKVISSGAFASCSALENVELPEGLTTIGCGAFADTALSELHIPATVQSLGEDESGYLEADLFGGTNPDFICSTAPDGAAEQYANAKNIPFVLCYDRLNNSNACGDHLIWSVDNGVLTISGAGDMDDYGTYGSTPPWQNETFDRVVVGYGVRSIGNYAFYGFSGLTSVTIPETVTQIGAGAFSQTGLTSVAIPDSVVSIGSAAFSGTGLTSVHIPDSVLHIEFTAFHDCPDLAFLCSTTTNGEAKQYADDSHIPFVLCYDQQGNSNACGDHLTWSIENGVLTISGAGEMYDFGNPYDTENSLRPPWADELYDEVVIGYGVTSIGSDAFNSAGLESSLTSIGDEAFLFCESLSGVVIPNSVTTIGERAFLQCTGMSTLTLGSGVTEIKIGAFASCSSLTSLVIPDNVEIIGISAFGGCSGLTSLTIGSGVTSIGATAFEGCEALTEINYNVPNLADLTDEHGLFAFGSPVNTPVTVTFGDNVRHVPAYLFDRYEPDYGPQITTVYFGNALTSVGHDAFYNCTTITDVNYGGTQQQWNAITIGSNNDPLQNATKNFVVSGTCYENLTWVFDPYTRTLTISGTGEIKESPWASYGSSMKTLVVNSGVTGICDFAFSGCTGLTNVTLPDSVASIGDHAFNDTAYYKDQSNWQNGVLYINNHVIKANQFHANGAYVIRPGTKTIAYSAFYGCSGLTSVTIPNSVTSICDNAFMACVGLTELTIPDGVTSIRRAAFSLCRGLTSVTIPDGVTSIGELAFSRCTGLTSVTIPDSVTSIDRGVFYYCGALADVYFDGTQQQWNGITISADMNDPLFAATIHCSDGTIGEAPEDTYSVTVDDQVALNLMLDLEARGVTTDAVSVTLNGQPVEYDVVQDGEQYRFSIVTAPAQLADPILVTAGGETLVETSVMDYCLALCGSEYDEYPEAQALAKALLQYGKAANDVFDYTDAEITTLDTLDTVPVQSYTGAKFSDGTHKVSGASFLALTKPVFRFYMNSLTEAQAYAYNQAGVSAAYADETVGETLQARFVKRQVNGETVVLVEVTGVSAENMAEEIFVTINGLGTIRFNGYAFAKAMANDSDPATQALGAALFNYSVAAYTCFKG